MEIRFKDRKPVMKDLINSKEKKVDLMGWGCEGEVIIKNWSFINYKDSDFLDNGTVNHWVHFHTIKFVDCTFKDVNFIGAVPLDRCTFVRCTFENCMLSEWIRWCSFYSCKFNFCLFSGYLHETSFRKCEYHDVLLKCYGDVSQKLEDNTKCSESKKIEILKYFYPKESKIFDMVKKGDIYYGIKIYDDKYLKRFQSIMVNGKECYEDIVNSIDFDLTHYRPMVRIIGKRAPLIEDCILNTEVLDIKIK